MDAQARESNTALRKLWIGVRFVVFGVGGFLLVTYSWIALITVALKDPDQMMNPYLAGPMLLVGPFSMLYGADVWRRWAYLCVFLATPVVVSLFILISHFVPEDASSPGWSELWGSIDPKLLGVLVFSLPTVVTHWIVRRYYRRQDARNACIDVSSSLAGHA